MSCFVSKAGRPRTQKTGQPGFWRNTEPSARLLAGDKDLQAEIKSMENDGGKVQACLPCADSYGVTEQLRKLGIEVKYMGEPLTDLIKGGWKILTF